MRYVCPACSTSHEVARKEFGNRRNLATSCPNCAARLLLKRDDDHRVWVTFDGTAPAPLSTGRVTLPYTPLAVPEEPIAPPFPEPPPPAPRPPAPPPPAPPVGTQPNTGQTAPPEPGPPRQDPAPFQTPRYRPPSGAEPPPVPSFFDPVEPSVAEPGREALPGARRLDHVRFEPPPRVRPPSGGHDYGTLLQDMSMMFRLETKKSGRRAMVWTGLTVLVVGGLVAAFLQWKMAEDARAEHAEGIRHLIGDFQVKHAEPEVTHVLPLPPVALPVAPTPQELAPGATGTVALAQPPTPVQAVTTTHPGTVLSHRLFLKVRQARVVRQQGP